MNERQERIERLAERWLEARSSEAEERELRDLLREGDLPESLRGWAMLFEGFEALSGEHLPESAAARLPGETADRLSEAAADCLSRERIAPRIVNPEGSRRRNIRLRHVLLWSAAAAVALGVLLGVELLRRPYCYIDGKPVYDKEVALRTTAYFEAFAALDAPGHMVDELIENH
ncbi:hypothetical protein [Alistipes sp.]|uniref:hypothetical protein n=1 Tax=Alistipes sp. TaxID=1872444 RepID=UPI003A84A6E5